MQMRCLAELMCSIILLESLALQCGLRHFLITFGSAVCGQHGKALLITKTTSFNRGDLFFCRKYQVYSKSVDSNSAEAKKPNFKNAVNSNFIVISIICTEKDVNCTKNRSAAGKPKGKADCFAMLLQIDSYAAVQENNTRGGNRPFSMLP